MPTTLTGLLLFVVLLLPGFAYVAIRERNTPKRKISTFRETVNVATVSVVADVLALVIFAGVRVLWPGQTPDVGQLIADSGTYLVDHYRLVGVWVLVLTAVAAGGAAGAACLANRAKPHKSTMSSWWLLFEGWYPRPQKPHIGCLLDDGSWVEGRFGSFNDEGDDTPDRDLILVEPLKRRLTKDEDLEDYPASTVCISARRIVTMYVTPVREEYWSAILRQEDGPSPGEGQPSDDDHAPHQAAEGEVVEEDPAADPASRQASSSPSEHAAQDRGA